MQDIQRYIPPTVPDSPPHALDPNDHNLVPAMPHLQANAANRCAPYQQLILLTQHMLATSKLLLTCICCAFTVIPTKDMCMQRCTQPYLLSSALTEMLSQTCRPCSV